MENQKTTKKLKGWQWALIVLGVLWVVAIITKEDPDPALLKRQQEQEAKQKASEAREDSLTTIKYGMEQLLKKSLRDPDSYERIAWDIYYVDEPAGEKKRKKGKKVHAQMWIQYRAKNGFGGYNVEKRYFNFDQRFDLIKEWKE